MFLFTPITMLIWGGGVLNSGPTFKGVLREWSLFTVVGERWNSENRLHSKRPALYNRTLRFYPPSFKRSPSKTRINVFVSDPYVICGDGCKAEYLGATDDDPRSIYQCTDCPKPPPASSGK